MSNYIKIYNHNIRRLSKNSPELINHLSNLELEFKITTLTETWSTPFNEHLIGIEGHNTFVQSRSSGLRGGSVAVMIHKNLKARLDLECPKSGLFEFVAVNVQIPNMHKQDIIALVV